MKRSEMVNKLWFYLPSTSGLNETDASDILDFLESWGMQPPFSNKMFQISARKDMEPSGNKWEPENE